MSNKFDFRTADALVEVVSKAADTLDVKNGQIEKYFAQLHDSYKDDGYDKYAKDMDTADQSIEAVILQLKKTAAQIASYADKLRELSHGG